MRQMVKDLIIKGEQLIEEDLILRREWSITIDTERKKNIEEKLIKINLELEKVIEACEQTFEQQKKEIAEIIRQRKILADYYEKERERFLSDTILDYIEENEKKIKELTRFLSV